MLKYFKESEFRGWFDKMDAELLAKLDLFREKWGAPVLISQANGAIGRSTGSGFHNYEKHGTVKAIDIRPSGMNSPEDFQRALDIVKEIKLRGIGIYPQWASGPGLHIDVGVRAGKPEDEYPAQWSAFYSGPNGEQEYFGIEKALNGDY